MSRLAAVCRLAAAVSFALAVPLALAADEETLFLPTVEVTTSKLPKSVDTAAAMITVVTGEDIRARGAWDLRTALALVAGVDIAPGGDAGPANSVPGMWGLREFDAFLLVVDGVPAGGAFNPAITTMDMTNVKRIEVLRGPAPVMFGATSFVGVIHVIHYGPGETPGRANVSLGTHSTALASLSADLGNWGPFQQSISANVETREFSQDDSSVERLHFLYRNSAQLEAGRLHFDLDAVSLKQDPYSPHPREGGSLTPRFPLDVNVNPSDARQDEDRAQLNSGFEREVSFGQWNTTLSVAHTNGNNVRGFLREDFAEDGVTPNADGFRQDISKTDLYFDTYLATQPAENLTLTYGLDWIYGRGEQSSDNFEYAVLPGGENRPDSGSLEIDESTWVKDTRSFAGLYVQLDWKPVDRLDIGIGVRLNNTQEDRHAQVVDHHAEPGEDTLTSSDSQDQTRGSGVIGASYALWQEGIDRVAVFADYRNTYKPAAYDFGPEGEGGILKPETADSGEIGFKGRHLQGRLEWEASYFLMNFENLVIHENIDGLPGLANAGTERFKGAEVEAAFEVCQDFRVTGTWAYHDARFVDYARLRPDGSIQQLGGNRLEMSPQNLGALGLVYSPLTGFNGSLVWNYVGARYLNKGNTAVADSYNNLDAGAGYRFDDWELRVDGYNLTDRRDAVAESELGDAQFYRLPGRTVMLTAGFNF